MSNAISTVRDAGREAALRTHVAVRDLAARASEQRGQTAAEYMGILLIVSLIIAALITAGVAGDIAGKVDELIGKIGGGGGGGTSGGGGGGGGGGAI